MPQRRWLVWLHRVGYVTSALVAMEIAFMGALAAAGWWRQHQMLVRLRSERAYKPGLVRQPEYIGPYLQALPSLASLSPEGFRFLAYPELRQQTFGVILRLAPQADRAEGLLLITDYEGSLRKGSKRYTFRLSVLEYERLMSTIDGRLDGFDGNDKLPGTDGTDYVFERVRSGRVTGGGGNLVEPYRSLGEVVLAAVRKAVPQAALPPANNDWYPEP